jgi:hypothetical protein
MAAYLIAQPARHASHHSDRSVVTGSALGDGQSFIELFKCAYQLDIDNPDRLRQHFDRLVPLTSVIAIAGSSIIIRCYLANLCRLLALREIFGF